MVNEQVDVSIIVPVFNAEKYLERCINSITSQTKENIEIICVDDGSTDNSLSILKKLSEDDNRVKVISQRNGGVSLARKSGLEKAKGEYIGFADADDWMEFDMIEQLYCTAVDNDVDVVCSGYYFEGDFVSEYVDDVPEGLYCDGRMDILRELTIYNLKNKSVGIRGSICSKIFRRKLIEEVFGLAPDNLAYSEDKMIVITSMLLANSVYMLKKSFYHYIKNPNSKVNTTDSSYLSKIDAFCQYAYSLYENPRFTESMRLQMEMYIIELLYKGINSRMPFKNKNLLWIDPYYLDRFPHNASIVIYGAGDFGETYYRQISRRSDVKIVGWVDPNFEKYEETTLKICSPENIDSLNYDYILLAYKNKDKADSVKRKLVISGVDESKILWFDQTEFFWRFAEANGFLDENWIYAYPRL